MRKRRRTPYTFVSRFLGAIAVLFGLFLFDVMVYPGRIGPLGNALRSTVNAPFGDLSLFVPLIFVLLGLLWFKDPAFARLLMPLNFASWALLMLTTILFNTGLVGRSLHRALSGQWSAISAHLLALTCGSLLVIMLGPALESPILHLFGGAWEMLFQPLSRVRRGKKKPALTSRLIPFHGAPDPLDDHGEGLPPLSIFASSSSSKSSQASVRDHEDTLLRKLSEHKISASLSGIEQGPTVTKYHFRPGVGVKLAQVQALGNDLALALAVPSVLVAPVDGSSCIGIAVHHGGSSCIGIGDLIPQVPKHPTGLHIPLGKDERGEVVIADLTEMPHLLIAGSTGSGKSVCLNVILAGLLARYGEDRLRLVLLDPKAVELSGFNGIPHLLRPVVTDPKRSAMALAEVVEEMEARYAVLTEAGVKKIDDYNRKHPKSKMPYLVTVIDELADLMSVAGKEVEASIVRLSAKARACGIYLVVATQRPSKQVCTGLIKGNLPSRIAFKVASDSDSRIILDDGGAEKLAGKGDMIFAPVGAPSRRMQCAFVSDDELESLVAHCARAGSSKKAPKPRAAAAEKTAPVIDAIPRAYTASGVPEDLVLHAERLVRASGTASVKRLMIELRIGRPLAVRVMDELERRSVVGPSNGFSPREVIAASEDETRIAPGLEAV